MSWEYRGPDYPKGPQSGGGFSHDDECDHTTRPKPTALEINACAERLIADSTRLDPHTRKFFILRVRAALDWLPASAPNALGGALAAMRLNPRAFALAGLIGQHCNESETR